MSKKLNKLHAAGVTLVTWTSTGVDLQKPTRELVLKGSNQHLNRYIASSNGCFFMFFHVSFSACQICSRTMHGCLGFRKALYRDMIVIYLLYKTVTYPNHSQEVRQIIFPNKRAILGCGNSCDFPRSQAPGNFPAMERRS